MAKTPQAKKRKLDQPTTSGSIYNFPTDRISADRLSYSQSSLDSFNLKGYHGGQSVVVWHGGTRQSVVVEFSEDGSYFLSGGCDCRVLLWSAKGLLGSKRGLWSNKISSEHGASVLCLAMSSDNQKIFSGGDDLKLFIHDTNE